MTNENVDQYEFWEELAPDWIASDGHTEIVSAPFGDSAMDRLSLRPGLNVLDVGCGSGSTTVELSRRVGIDGRATGVDIAPAMIAQAMKRADAAHIGNVSFLAADAQAEPFQAATFDAIYSRFGVMFFANPKVAFTNLRRALRPDGVLAFACWENIFLNEWMFVPGSAVVSVTGSLPPMPGPGEPGPFSLADRTAIESLLRDSGFKSVEVTSQAETLTLRGEEIESLVTLTRRVGPVREALRTANAETAALISTAVRSALLERAVDGVVKLNSAAFIVSAR
jgi:SAM-dependent methyltransferase